MNQTHSTTVLQLPNGNYDEPADAAWTSQEQVICAVLTADCLPVFFYHSKENKVAVSHAGWRGLLNGIIENTVHSMTSSAEHLKVWLGPAIGPDKFEVGEEVKNNFVQLNSMNIQCFKLCNNSEEKNKYFMDIYQLARIRLQSLGITSITGGEYCTVGDHNKFFSYRRDGETGRMANLIWLSGT